MPADLGLREPGFESSTHRVVYGGTASFAASPS